MAATIKMVAQRAGVSVATVSKYLNGGNVREPFRSNVQQAVAELNYSINEVARSLKTNRTFTVGVLAASIRSIFLTSVIAAIQYELLQHGYSTIIADYQVDKTLEKKQLDVLLKRQVDGIILFPEENEGEIIDTIRSRNIPVVMVDNFIENRACDAVVTDGADGIYQLTKKLLENNHTRISILSGPNDMFTARQRLSGYRKAFEDYGIAPDESLIVPGNYHLGTSYAATKQLLRRTPAPTALIATNYYSAIGALQALNELHIAIPQELSFCTFDALEFNCIMTPEITTAAQPMQEMGQTAARRLLQRIEGSSQDFPRLECLKTEVCFTDSIRKLEI